MAVFHTILFPTDFSEQSQAVFPFACRLARDQGARLLVLYADPPPLFHGEVVARRQEPDYEERLRNELRRFQPSDAGGRVEHRLEEGEAAEVILRVAREERCDLIVMATHGRTGLARLLMGSVAEKVLREAPCPITLCAPPRPGRTD